MLKNPHWKNCPVSVFPPQRIDWFQPFLPGEANFKLSDVTSCEDKGSKSFRVSPAAKSGRNKKKTQLSTERPNSPTPLLLISPHFPFISTTSCLRPRGISVWIHSERFPISVHGGHGFLKWVGKSTKGGVEFEFKRHPHSCWFHTSVL